MNCPACNGRLREREQGSSVIDVCASCEGVWFEAGEVTAYVDVLLEEEAIPEADLDLLRRRRAIKEHEHPTRSCPTCDIVLKPFNYAYDSNIIVDKCPVCKGVWADADEVIELAIYTKGNPLVEDMGRAFVKVKDDLEDEMNQDHMAHVVPGEVYLSWMIIRFLRDILAGLLLRFGLRRRGTGDDSS